MQRITWRVPHLLAAEFAVGAEMPQRTWFETRGLLDAGPWELKPSELKLGRTCVFSGLLYPSLSLSLSLI